MPIKINDLTLFNLKEISRKFGVSIDSIRSYIKTLASQVIKWLKYRAKPTPVLRKRIKRGIARMKRL